MEGAGLRVLPEAFPDRAYLPDGTLVPRNRPGALLDDQTTIAERAVRLAREGVVSAVDGSHLRLEPATLHLHGDTPALPSTARRVRDALLAAGVRLQPASA